MYATEQKSDVQEHLARRLDYLWTLLRLKNPKGRGLSAKRSQNWDRYVEWIWKHRVERLAPEDIAEKWPSPITEGFSMTPRAVQKGIDLATRSLGAI